ncbi:MAG: LEA type 2 family protein [Myxococcota bacterium]
MKTYVVAFACVFLFSGCEELSEISPKVQFDTLDVKNIDFDSVTADFVFDVDNPNPIPVSLARFSYDLELEAVPLLEGDGSDGLDLPATGSAQVRLPATLVWSDVWDTIQAIRGEDQVDFGLAGSFGFDTRFGPLDLPYQTDGSFPALRTPKFRLGTLKVDQLNLARGEATVLLNLNVDNDHGSTLDFTNLNYALSLRGTQVGTGLLTTLGTVDGASNRDVQVPLTINLLKAGTAITQVLTAGGPIDAGLDATVDVDTPFGVLPLAIDERGNVQVER